MENTGNKQLITLPHYQMESKNLTLSKYSYSEVQQNVLTLIQEQLKPFMTKDAHQAELQIDEMGEPYVVIDCEEAGSKKNKDSVIDEVKKMYNKPIQFRWRHKSWKNEIVTNCVIVTGYHDVVGTSTIRVNFNRWAIPFLVWYGVGVGGTVYDKTISLMLEGKYTKRIYKLICSYRDKGDYYYDIKAFREDLGVPKSYNTTMIRQKILEPAKRDIDATNSDVKFDFQYMMEKNGKSKHSAKQIHFIIHWKKTRDNLNQQDQKLYSKCYRIVSICHVPEADVVAICDLLLNNGMMKIVCERWDYYEDKICAGDRMASGQPYTTAIAINAMRKMMREELEKLGVDPRKMSCLYPKGQE